MHWGDFIFGAAMPPFWAVFWSLVNYRRLNRRYIRGLWMFIAVVSCPLNLLIPASVPVFGGSPGGASGNAVSAAACAAWWWWDSGQRKRAAKLLGAKARAIRDGMARRMRQLAPRPVAVPS